MHRNDLMYITRLCDATMIAFHVLRTVWKIVMADLTAEVQMRFDYSPKWNDSRTP